MGGRLGDWWVGKELEHTKFYGQPTLFFDKASAFITCPAEALSYFDYYYFNINREDWWAYYYSVLDVEAKQFWRNVGICLKHNKRCTFDLPVAALISHQLSYLRKMHNDKILLMFRVEIPTPEMNDWCIKVQNTDKQRWKGVYIQWSEDFLHPIIEAFQGASDHPTFTAKEEYKEDIPGKEWLENAKKKAAQFQDRWSD